MAVKFKLVGTYVIRNPGKLYVAFIENSYAVIKLVVKILDLFLYQR